MLISKPCSTLPDYLTEGRYVAMNPETGTTEKPLKRLLQICEKRLKFT